MTQEPRTTQGRQTVAYIKAVVFTLLEDPADRAQAEVVLREVARRIANTEEAAMDGLCRSHETGAQGPA